MTETTKQGPPNRKRHRRGRPRPRTTVSDQPVPLHKRSASHFQRGDRQRGKEYFLEGRVHVDVDGTRARARVEGSEERAYNVGVDWSQVGERVLHGFCECQRFAKGRPCKHLWATLLAVAESGLERPPPGRDRVSLRKDRPGNWQELNPAAAGRAPAGAAPRHNSNAPSRNAKRGRPAPRHQGGRGSGYGGHWRSQLSALRAAAGQRSGPGAAALATAAHTASHVRLLINTAASQSSSQLVLDVFGRSAARAGKPGRLTPLSVDPAELEALLAPAGTFEAAGASPAIVAAVPAAAPVRKVRGRRPAAPPPARVQRLQLSPRLYDPVLSHLAARGILGWWDGHKLGEPPPLEWKAAPWQLTLHLEVTDNGGARLLGALERDGDSAPLSAPVMVLDGGEGGHLVLFAACLSPLDAGRELDAQWIELLRGAGEIVIPKDDLEEALTALLELPDLPRLETPEELRLAEESSSFRPRLVLEADSAPAWMNPPLLAELSFDYGELRVHAGDPRGAVVDWQQQQFLRRDAEKEHRALVRLLELGLRPVESAAGHELELSPAELPAVAEPLLAEGWTVETHGHSLRPPSAPALKVKSGIDWFELSGSMDFDGDPVELAAVLAAISKGDRFIQLEDGSRGLLPAAWMETYDSLAQLSHDSSDGNLRFLPSQALLVDALLSAMPAADVDSAFARLREKLQSFDRIKPKKELKGFGGTLRAYQRHGLGWLTFLRDFGLGGVLADDMGLGKTVQVLALLQTFRTAAKTTGLPSLVVAPRSLVYNWIEEASRFTPKLKVVEYAGPEREAVREKLKDYDLAVTTYGTMRRDIAYLASVEFDTLILDEAQAIKNPASQTAKASSLLVGRNRLALTGTPIENHLGELGSIFEYLNPGLLGRLHKLEALATGRVPSQHELEIIARGIRPFILRRTKAQVLPDLPPKTEQILYCTMKARQRELYDQVRASYQVKLLQQVGSKGVGGSAIQVLEALLRLRQIACHPGLVNEEWEEAGSAKLESLFEQVAEVLDEGHKLLIFSQFTSLLAYVRKHLDERHIPYAYLDGQTRDRAEVVDRFQTDERCNLFLVSLKAGGFGLNLTAAGYVFLLDPWWNPAVEAQAIDRAHRIGQTQPVFAYRMIARDTVEEKILELQSKKRKLADAILDGEGLGLRDLTAEDLQLLLS